MSKRSQNDSRNGCLLGNFAADSSDDKAIRSRLNTIFAGMEKAVLYCLKAAVAAGELRAGTNCEPLANGALHLSFLNRTGLTPLIVWFKGKRAR